MAALVTSTERLELRQLLTSDAAFMLQMVNSPGWLRYIGDRKVYSLEDAVTYLEKGAIASYALNGFGLWLVLEKSTGKPVGLCGLIRREGLTAVDIGFALLPGNEGRGFAYEAAVATVAMARTFHLKELVAITTPDNTSSIRLLEKLSFTFREQLTLPGSTEILNLYHLSIEE